jgi:hypothetical protein
MNKVAACARIHWSEGQFDRLKTGFTGIFGSQSALIFDFDCLACVLQRLWVYPVKYHNFITNQGFIMIFKKQL